MERVALGLERATVSRALVRLPGLGKIEVILCYGWVGFAGRTYVEYVLFAFDPSRSSDQGFTRATFEKP